MRLGWCLLVCPLWLDWRLLICPLRLGHGLLIWMLLGWHLLICMLRLVHLWTIYLLWRPPHSRIISTPVLIIALLYTLGQSNIYDNNDKYNKKSHTKTLPFSILFKFFLLKFTLLFYYTQTVPPRQQLIL